MSSGHIADAWLAVLARRADESTPESEQSRLTEYSTIRRGFFMHGARPVIV
jgi:hypothetical protein